jgi:PPOX class probable F420-dependent enzyme
MTTPDYGFEDVKHPGEKLPWAETEKRLIEARTYWIATTRPDGRPHIAPVWGVWTDDTFIFETSSRSAKARNVAVNPSIVLHLDHTPTAVIVEGRAEIVEDETTKRAYARACTEKYDFDVEPYLTRPVSRVIRIVPRVAYSYKEHLGQTATRWDF